MRKKAKQPDIRAQIVDLLGDEEALLLEPEMFDVAIVGVLERFGQPAIVCYDREKVIEVLMADMPREDAEEYYSFNTLGAWMGEGTPAFLRKPDV